MNAFIKKHVSENPRGTNAYSIKKRFFKLTHGCYNFMPGKEEIQAQIRFVKASTKLIDLEIPDILEKY